ncbi:beta strand repeat-containing protein [Azospirillum argentinense]
MPQTWYRDGSVTLINGSTAVTGFGTLWASQVFPGDVFSPDGDRFYEVAAVASNTALTLRTPYTGTSRPPVAQVNTITPRVVSANTAQTDEISINDFVYQFTSDASPTVAEICAGLAARINASPTCPMTAVATGGTLVLTAKTPGQPLTVIVSVNLTSGLTAPASAGSGYMVIRNFAGTMAADIANRMADLVRKWQLREDEFVAWMAGDPRGGPNGDGKYPLTDTQGNVRLVETPSALLEMIDGGLMDNVQLVIDAVEDDVVAAQLAATEASEAAVATAAARNAAQASQAAALASETSAKASETAAKASAQAGSASAGAAAQSALTAARAETSALAAKTAAETANAGAQAAKTAAEGASAAAKASETAAKGSETAAKTSETGAAASAQTATTRATASATSASQAASSATAAAGSASAAATSAQTATTKASEAAASAAAGKTSETNAKTSETNAAGSASAAAGSASNAATSAQAAAGSATAADTAKTGAQASAATATNAATAASGSATAAQTSAGAAKASETAAATAAAQGQGSASASAASATQAAASATTAATKAGDASTSANAAANSANAAQGSANTAATHLSGVQANATAAANARTAAEGARDQAAASAATAASSAQAADASAQSASAGATNANTAAAVAGTSATDAVNAKVDAVSARDSAQQLRDQASAQRELAAAWASNGFNVPVQSGAYSALHWAAMAKEYADTAGTIVGGFSFSAIGDGNQQKFTASMPGDTMHFVQGSNININYDAALKRLTFSATSKPVDTEHAGLAVRDDNTAGKTFLSLVPANIAHQSLGGAGTNTHAQIDAHLGSVGNPHGTTAAQVAITAISGLAGSQVQAALADLQDKKATKDSPTFSGVVTLAQDPTNDLHAATRRYVESRPAKLSARFATTGDLDTVLATTQTLTGPSASYATTGTTINGSNSVTGVADAVSRIKVGATVTGTGIPASTTVSAVSGTTVTLSANATVSGTPSLTFTQTIGALTVDGGTPGLLDRVLVKDQTTGGQRGLYVVSTVGTSSVPWVLTRTTDTDSWADLVGAMVSVNEGATNAGTLWLSNATPYDGVLGTTVLTWSAVHNAQSKALNTLATNGLIARTSAGTVTARTITGTSSEVLVTNGDGVSGNPTLSLPATLALGGKAVTVGDANFTIQDTADPTKLVKFELGNLSAGTTRTLTVPNASGTLSLDGHTHDWSAIVSGKPDSARGYGILDTLSNGPVQQVGHFAGLKLWDTDGSHIVNVAIGSDVSAERSLTVYTGDANRALTLNGDATISGTNTGDQTITLTGDVTGSGTGGFATSIANNAVSNAKLRQGAATSVIGRAANSAGNVADIAATADNTFLARRGGLLTFTSPTWGDITNASKPTSLSGYGITDAQPLNAMLTTLAGLDGNAGVLVQTASNAVSKRGIGTINASDILDRTAGDSRYAQVTGNVTFGGNLYVSNGHPSVNFRESDAAADTKAWTLDVENGRFLGMLANDSNTAWTTWLNVQRSGMTVSDIALSGSALTFNGSNILTTATGAQLSGAAFTGNVTMRTAGGGNLKVLGTGNAGVELGRDDGVASTPFLYFHSGATYTTYDVSLMASGGNGTNGQGTLNIQSALLQHNGSNVLTTAHWSTQATPNTAMLRDGAANVAAAAYTASGTYPALFFHDTDATTNSKRWRLAANTAQMDIAIDSDDFSSSVGVMSFYRNTTTPTGISAWAPFTVNANVAANGAHLHLQTGGGSLGRKSVIRHYGTFAGGTADTGQRVVGRTEAGFSTANWGTEYYAICLNSATNDAASDANMTAYLTLTKDTAQFKAKTETYLAQLGTTVGNSVLHNQAVSGSGTSNTDSLRTSIQRFSGGPSNAWNSAGWRIQRQVDTTPQGFIQFGGEGDGYGVSIGSGAGMPSRLYVPSSGDVVVNGAGLTVSPEAAGDVTVGKWSELSAAPNGSAAVGSNLYLDNSNILRAKWAHGSIGSRGILFNYPSWGDVRVVSYSGATTANQDLSAQPTYRLYHEGNLTGAWLGQDLRTSAAPTFNGVASNGSILALASNGIRHKQSNGATGVGVIHRNDGGNFWLLLTNNGDANGDWNTLRPFQMNLTSGQMTFGHGAIVRSGLLTDALRIGSLNSSIDGETLSVSPGSGTTGQNVRIGIRNSGNGDGSPNAVFLGVDGNALAGRAFIDTRAYGVASATPLDLRIGGTTNVTLAADGMLTVGRNLSTQYPAALAIAESTHATSRRAAMVVGSWVIGQDSPANGTRDLFIYGIDPDLHVLKAGLNGVVDFAKTPTVAGRTMLNSANFSPFKNKLHNANMQVRQRGIGPIVTPGFLADRWTTIANTATFTDKVYTQIVYDINSGSNWLELRMSNAVTSGGSSVDALLLQQSVPAEDASDLRWGTPWAKPATLSFRYQTNAPGVYTVVIRSGDAGRSWVGTFAAIAGEGTVTLSIPAPTSGNFMSVAGFSFAVCLAAGGDYRTNTSGQWVTGNRIGVSGMGNFTGTAGNYFRITEAVVAEGTDTLPYAALAVPYALDLARCQRFYQVLPDAMVSGWAALDWSYYTEFVYPVPMRAPPTVTLNQVGLYNAKNLGVNSVSATRIRLQAQSASEATSYFVTHVYLSAEI